MPWVCTTMAFPWVARVARTSQSGLPAVPHHRGIGRRFRRHLVTTWGVSHGAAATAWSALTTCVWIGAPVAAGGVGWLAWPGGLGNALGGVLPLSGGQDVGGAGLGAQAVAVPEPYSWPLLMLACGALVLINERRRAKRRAARVSQFTGWPPPKPAMITVGGDMRAAKGLLVACGIGAVFWALLLVPAWFWGLL